MRKQFLLGCAIFLLVLMFLPAFFVGAKSETANPIVVRPSNVLGYLVQKLENEPNINPKDLAAIGNKFIERNGFDYAFDACDIVNRYPHNEYARFEEKEETWDASLTLVTGEKMDVKLITIGPPGDGGMCSECFFWLPAKLVSNRRMLLVADGVGYRLKRPQSFILDQAWLMDSKMKKVLRKWQLPYQLGPEGISADGTKLYYGFYSEELRRVLVLELSEDGSTKFLARTEIDPQGESDPIEDHPDVKNVGDVMFVRFRVNGKSFIVRYTSPCT